MRGTRSVHVLLAGMVAIGLTGCGGGDDGKAAAPSPAASASSSPGAGDGAGGQGQDDTERDGTGKAIRAPGGTAPAFAPSLDNVLMQDDVPMPSREGTGTVTVAVESLTVRGKVMELRLVLVPHAQTAVASSFSIFTLNGSNVMDPVLTDRENLKQYVVLRSGPSGVNRWETRQTDSVANEAPLRYQAFFSAPQERVQTLDLQLSGSLPSFDRVPVTYAE